VVMVFMRNFSRQNRRLRRDENGKIEASGSVYLAAPLSANPNWPGAGPGAEHGSFTKSPDPPRRRTLDALKCRKSEIKDIFH
jgi:hypothetical protein